MAERSVVWTATAIRQRREILHYWTVRNGSASYSRKLVKLIEKRIKVIVNNPLSFQLTDYPDTRISAMENFSILYKTDETGIIITAFWDNRQDPKKLPEIIKYRK